MNRAEYKYNMACDIIAWSGWTGERYPYTETQLRDMTVPELEKLHQIYYWKRREKMDAIGPVR